MKENLTLISEHSTFCALNQAKFGLWYHQYSYTDWDSLFVEFHLSSHELFKQLKQKSHTNEQARWEVRKQL